MFLALGMAILALVFLIAFSVLSYYGSTGWFSRLPKRISQAHMHQVPNKPNMLTATAQVSVCPSEAPDATGLDGDLYKMRHSSLLHCNGFLRRRSTLGRYHF